jgi:hypothetical protein
MVDDCEAPLAELFFTRKSSLVGVYAGVESRVGMRMPMLSQACAKLVDLGPESRRGSIKRLDDDAKLERLGDFDYDGALVFPWRGRGIAVWVS